MNQLIAKTIYLLFFICIVIVYGAIVSFLLNNTFYTNNIIDVISKISILVISFYKLLKLL